MTHEPVVVSQLAHANPQTESDSVVPASLIRRVLATGTAIATAFRGAIALPPAEEFVAPPVGDLPLQAEPVGKDLPGMSVRFRRLLQKDADPDPDPPRKGPPRLMPSNAERKVNVMPSHAMAAGGRPMIMKIPGK